MGVSKGLPSPPPSPQFFELRFVSVVLAILEMSSALFLCIPGHPQTQRLPCLCLLGAELKACTAPWHLEAFPHWPLWWLSLVHLSVLCFPEFSVTTAPIPFQPDYHGNHFEPTPSSDIEYTHNCRHLFSRGAPEFLLPPLSSASPQRVSWWN